MKIEITQNDIDTGNPRQSLMCPISIATKRARGILTDRVIVGTRHIAVFHNHRSKEIYSLPPEAQAFIRAFDEGETVEPITFEVERLPD